MKHTLSKISLLGLVVILMVLSGCGKKAEDRSTAKTPAPFSRGPSGPPVISEPSFPLPK